MWSSRHLASRSHTPGSKLSGFLGQAKDYWATLVPNNQSGSLQECDPVPSGDYDVWKDDEPVSVEKVIANLTANTANVKKLLKAAMPHMARTRSCECATALKYALLTERRRVLPKTKRALWPLIGKYFTA